ncbi:MAG: hypothetical protein DRG87_04620 [Deltaproteobacteria bacterium]|nr:MAG: hypothetical protein DRG87_04620 [Deltaproteobacteria bacterium]
MYGKIRVALSTQLQEIRDQGLYKDERVISGPQGVEITVETGEEVLKFCANNYLGLSSHPKVIEAAHRALDEWGYGMSSVRFICGTQSIHKELERKTSEFLGMDDLEAKLTEARDAQYRLIATDGVHPIVPIMLYDAKLAQDMAAQLLGEGIYVIGFSYPVVPKGQARIRVQISAAHTRAHLDTAIDAFERVGKRLGVVK